LFTDPLSYLAEYEVLVCRDYGAVRNWNTYLRDYYSVDSKT